MGLATFHAHTAPAGFIPPGFLPYLAAVGHPLAITVTVYYGIKAVVFLAAGTVAMCTKDDKRREACVEIVRIVCRGWPWPPAAVAERRTRNCAPVGRTFIGLGWSRWVPLEGTEAAPAPGGRAGANAGQHDSWCGGLSGWFAEALARSLSLVLVVRLGGADEPGEVSQGGRPFDDQVPVLVRGGEVVPFFMTLSPATAVP